MKGFIEVTTRSGANKLINANGIYSVIPAKGDGFKVWIESLNGENEGFMETYDEVKALIEKAQGETSENVKMEWKDIEKAIKQIKEYCSQSTVERCYSCPFNYKYGCVLHGDVPSEWRIEE